MTPEQKEYIELKHNVYVDIETSQFNLDGYDADYGWQPVPKEWLQNAINATTEQ